MRYINCGTENVKTVINIQLINANFQYVIEETFAYKAQNNDFLYVV